ncbi:G patch domain-containing protein 1-like isoform X2 [Branchiostoma floridae]|uniref:G patch domain-containing protein 1-like isoform X2 n=1 Tax=Branchiostoma floridae TaxID=7739 RepID=A0A9J7LC44_BRAFL|nr:G patch domain-containing protein 1-like isoform X2 [Branchiostoma floridae]
MSAEDSDDDLVYHGTPLPPLQEDAPVKKPVSREDQVVTDRQGRRRFHGAFTGGFSAGYYNTVDTPEGWTPATFVSSRSSKAGQLQQRPEDFMDDEDMGEFGIAPKTVTTTREFLSEEKEDVRRKRAAAAADQHSVLPALLQDLIIPARESIGVRLLRRMGWRDGAGIGAKVRRKIKMKRQTEASSQRTYGCAPPPGHQHSEVRSYIITLSLVLNPPNVLHVSVFGTKPSPHSHMSLSLVLNPPHIATCLCPWY